MPACTDPCLISTGYQANAAMGLLPGRYRKQTNAKSGLEFWVAGVGLTLSLGSSGTGPPFEPGQGLGF